MQITIELPEDIINQLQPVNLSRRILELIVADRSRSKTKTTEDPML